jgi:hypothetical protein
MRACLITAICLLLNTAAFAQTAGDAPATKDDIELYLRAMHSHDMIQRTMEAELKPMHQIMRDQFEKDGLKVPADAEASFNKMMDDLLTHMPIDEMTQAMVPVYQKHFTKGDIDSLIAFYTSPTGQKVLQEMPEITGETMQAMTPIMAKYLEQSRQRVRQEAKKMEKAAPAASPAQP